MMDIKETQKQINRQILENIDFFPLTFHQQYTHMTLFLKDKYQNIQ